MQNQSLYYRHSGQFSSPGVAKALLGGCIAAVVLGVAYGFVENYAPLGVWMVALLIGGTGFLEGKVLVQLLKAGKVRNVGLALLMTAIAAGLLWITAWEAWMFALVQRSNLEVSPWVVVLHPEMAWNFVQVINENGIRKLGGNMVTGIPLWGAWAIEAGFLIGIPLKMVKKAILEHPFCEACNKWCGTQNLLRLKPGEKAALRAQLEVKDFGVLTDLGKASDSDNHFWLAYLQGCANCDTTQSLCVDDILLTRDKNGKLQRKEKPLITRLILSPEDTVAVATSVAMLTHVEAPAEATVDAPTDTGAVTMSENNGDATNTESESNPERPA